MDINSILGTLMGSDAVEQVSKDTGISVSDAKSVLEEVVPTLLKGAQGQASDASTAQSFLEALSSHGQADTSSITSFLQNVDTEDGAKIVGHLLGSNTEEVAAKATKKSGVSTSTVLKIMSIAAPLLMSTLGKSAKSSAKSSDSSSMASIVGGLLDGVDAGDVLNIVKKLI